VALFLRATGSDGAVFAIMLDTFVQPVARNAGIFAIVKFVPQRLMMAIRYLLNYAHMNASTIV